MTNTTPAAIRTVDVSDYADYERPDMTRPYEVIGAPYGETVAHYFATEAEARAMAADFAALTGTYMTSWGEQPVNTEARIFHYVEDGAHSAGCTAYAVDMARENGAPDDDTARGWVANWDADGGRANYGACTCDATPAPAVAPVVTAARDEEPTAGNPMPVMRVYVDGERAGEVVGSTREDDGTLSVRIRVPNGRDTLTLTGNGVDFAAAIASRANEVIAYFRRSLAA